MRKEIQIFIKNYLENVIQNDWHRMQKHITLDINESNITALTKKIIQTESKNKTQELFIPILMQEVNNLRMIREERLFLAENVLNISILKLLFSGCFLTLLACVFLETASSKLNSAIFLVILSILLGLLLSAIIGLDHPYQGDLSVSPEPLEAVLKYINSTGLPSTSTNDIK